MSRRGRFAIEGAGRTFLGMLTLKGQGRETQVNSLYAKGWRLPQLMNDDEETLSRNMTKYSTSIKGTTRTQA